MNKFKTTLLGCALALASTATAQYFSGGRIEGKDGTLFLVDEFRYYRQTRLEGVLDSTSLIANINRLLKARGIDYYPTIVPIKSRIYSDRLPDNVNLPPNVLSQYDFIMTQFRASGVHDVDLNRLLLNSDQRNREYPFFYREDHHWSGVASALAARHVADLIQQNNDLSKYDVVKSTVAVGPAAILPKATLETDARPPLPTQTERYLPTFVKFEEGGDLLGDEYLPIVVTGDSFARGEDYDEGFWPYASLISHHLERGVLNFAVENQGPWTPLLNYFKSASYQENPPVVLIHAFWELFMTDMRFRMPDNYFEQVAPYIMGECQSSRLTLSSSGKVNTPRAAQLGEYASFTLPPFEGSASLELNYGTQTSSIPLDPRKDSMGYYDILLPASDTALKGITVKASTKAANLKVCALPGSFNDAITVDNMTIDFATRNLYNVIFSKNFYDTIDEQNYRWAFGKSASLEFYARGGQPIRLNFKAFSPFPNQVITVLLNGKPLGQVTSTGQQLIAQQSFTPVKGRNRLELAFSQWRSSSPENNMRIDKNDSRDLAASFSQLQLMPDYQRR